MAMIQTAQRHPREFSQNHRRSVRATQGPIRGSAIAKAIAVPLSTFGEKFFDDAWSGGETGDSHAIHKAKGLQHGHVDAQSGCDGADNDDNIVTVINNTLTIQL
ncbi:hypothetical protein N7507_007106 [Penicillium longicatenatum]|nr:hypothetical protein N7507_007106 [Penicillium longicatenatum]